jgi:glycosyltransferase involved in cell wall biosynthesis
MTGGAIPPVPAGEHRPLWSVLIPSRNSGPFLEKALESVLAQDRGSEAMEILVVDDHSDRDDPAEIVSRIAGARARLIAQKANVGKSRNYQTGIVASRGKLIHQLHADDRVRPGFYAAMESAFAAFPEAGAFFCESAYVDGSGAETGRTGLERDTVGIIDGWLEKIVVQQRVQTPSIVLRREVYEALGGFDPRLDAFEDWEMWIRVATRYPVGFIPQPLAEYRISSGNTSTQSMLAGSRTAVLKRMIAIVDGYLPPSVVRACKEERNKAMAQYLTQFIPPLMAARRFRAVVRVYRDALSFSAAPRTWYRLLSYTRHHRSMQRA